MIRVVFHPVNLVDFELVEHRDPCKGFVTIEINELANLFVQHFSILVASFEEKFRQNVDQKGLKVTADLRIDRVGFLEELLVDLASGLGVFFCHLEQLLFPIFPVMG